MPREDMLPGTPFREGAISHIRRLAGSSLRAIVAGAGILSFFGLLSFAHETERAHDLLSIDRQPLMYMWRFIRAEYAMALRKLQHGLT